MSAGQACSSLHLPDTLLNDLVLGHTDSRSPLGQMTGSEPKSRRDREWDRDEGTLGKEGLWELKGKEQTEHSFRH